VSLVRGLPVRRRVLVSLCLLVLALFFRPAEPVGASVREPVLRATWPTFGYDAARTGRNPLETRLGRATVGGLHAVWRTPLGGATITEPVVAAGVPERGRALVYVGTEHGDLLAVDATTGTVAWRDRLGSVATACQDLPGGVFGISGTPVLDPETNRLYVADSSPTEVAVYAVDAATGDVEPGWPVTVSHDPTHVHVWGALTLSAGLLDVTTAGMCDLPPYYGRVVAIDTSAARIAEQWSVVHDGGAIVGGGGIWGYGGASIDPATGDVLVATGNALFPERESQPDGERLVRLSASLHEVASDFPEAIPGIDVDFGATPVPYRAAGCPSQVAVMNKTGQLFVYELDAIADGPVQRLQVASNESIHGLGLFIGLPAYDAATRTLYVANPGPDSAGFRHGLDAFRVGSDCMLHTAWQQTVGPDGTTTESSPTVANGVVYYADGLGGEIFAFDAGDGRELWNSGGVIGGPVFAPPVVVDGRMYVAAWNGETGGALLSFEP
jgi:DNA-binding beta-propeller fold protein YncE